MATVELAEDALLGRQVALKRVLGTADPSGLSRLRREALAGASVSHPNLVSIYDVVTSADGHLVIVMEYVPGETLRDLLTRQGRLSTGDVLRILEGVAAGLEAIHALSIVHRDVKPSNILLGTDGAVKVADLGIASVPDRTRITASGSVLGSLSYMAPEQLEDAPATPAIDVYALAAMTFELLSGTKAREEANPVALAHAISTQPPPSLATAWPDAPPAAVDLLDRAMARDPHDRPRSAGDFVGRLRAALEPRATERHAAGRPAQWGRDPVAAGRVEGGPPTTGRGAMSRRGVLAAALIALAGLAVAVIAVAASGGSHPAKTVAGRHSSTTASHTSAAHSATATAPASASQTGTGAGGVASSGPASSTSATVASTPSTAASGASPGAPAASDPVGAVESFYGLAASHRYQQAWAMADPSLQTQLGGYNSFQQGQAGDRSISFNSARTVNQSGTTATVAIKTTSVRNDGTHHCSGTVDLVAGGSPGRWQLHQVHIGCA
jgi:protein kinase-like protein